MIRIIFWSFVIFGAIGISLATHPHKQDARALCFKLFSTKVDSGPGNRIYPQDSAENLRRLNPPSTNIPPTPDRPRNGLPPPHSPHPRPRNPPPPRPENPPGGRGRGRGH